MARPSGSDRTRPELRRQCRPKPGLQACGELPGVVAEPPVCRGSVHHSKVMPVTGYVNPLTAAPPRLSRHFRECLRLPSTDTDPCT